MRNPTPAGKVRPDPALRFLAPRDDPLGAAIAHGPSRCSLQLAAWQRHDIFVLDGSVHTHDTALISSDYLSMPGPLDLVWASDATALILSEPLDPGAGIELVRSYERRWRMGAVEGLAVCDLRIASTSIALVQWCPGVVVTTHDHPHGEEIYVLDGRLLNAPDTMQAGDWVRLTPGMRHAPSADEPTLILLRNGHLKGLRPSAGSSDWSC
ncbi:MAG TPA: cupin domain-containing protein [Sphingomonas sp.]|nr:cupin domain-containing protein [Sphingomonas sp.]